MRDAGCGLRVEERSMGFGISDCPVFYRATRNAQQGMNKLFDGALEAN